MKLDTGWVTFSSAGENFPGYFARPPEATPGMPAVVIIHEAFGVDEYIEDVVSGLRSHASVPVAATDVTTREPGSASP